MNIMQPSTMSHDDSNVVVSLNDVGKVYKLYSRPIHRVLEAVIPSRKYQLHKKFDALNNISLTIKKGQTLGIIGRNGSGKSTLLQIICGITKPTVGKLAVNGRISALLELGAGFNPEFSGRENVYLNGSLMGIEKNEMDACLDDIISFADIGRFIDQPVKTYSSGMYVRLAFAVAINVKPDILVVDEALSVGDTAFQAKCFAKFKEFQEKGITILFVTHSMDLVARYCNDALLLENGSIIKYGPAKEVVDEYNRRTVSRSSQSNLTHIESTESTEKSENTDDYEEGDVREPQTVNRRETRIIRELPNVLLKNAFNENDLAYKINPNENRYGNSKAEIASFGIDSIGKSTKHSIIHGEIYRFWFYTLFHANLESPVTAFTIKDVKGFDLTGTNTMFKGIDVGPVKKDDIILTEFEQRMMLNPGSYLLSFGCAGFESGEYVVYDRRYDVITFDVISDKSSVGFFDLDSQIKISTVSINK